MVELVPEDHARNGVTSASWRVHQAIAGLAVVAAAIVPAVALVPADGLAQLGQKCDVFVCGGNHNEGAALD